MKLFLFIKPYLFFGFYAYSVYARGIYPSYFFYSFPALNITPPDTSSFSFSLLFNLFVFLSTSFFITSYPFNGNSSTYLIAFYSNVPSLLFLESLFSFSLFLLVPAIISSFTRVFLYFSFCFPSFIPFYKLLLIYPKSP